MLPKMMGQLQDAGNVTTLAGDLEVDFIVVRDGEVTAIEVKSGRRGMNSGLPAFVEAFSPKRSFVVGTSGVNLEDFLSSEVDGIVL